MSSAPHPVRGPPGSWEPPQSSPEPLRHSGPTVSHPAFCLLLTMYSRSMNGSFTATTLTPFSMQARSTRRPMRPNLPGRRLGVCPQSPQPADRGGVGREGLKESCSGTGWDVSIWGRRSHPCVGQCHFAHTISPVSTTFCVSLPLCPLTPIPHFIAGCIL